VLVRWTARSLLSEPGSLIGSVGGVALALLLVMLVEAMFAGEAQRIVEYLERSRADVWVMQRGVSNMHMASSLVRKDVVEAVRATPGVRRATPILYVNAFLRAGGRRWFSYVVGLRPDAASGGPWAMVDGGARARAGEVVVPDVVASKARLGLGDEVELLGRRLRVSGVSAGTYSMANSVTFVSYDDLADLLSAPEAASYVLVEADGTVSAEALAARIRERIRDVNVMTRADFVESDRRMAMQMGVEIIEIMTWVGSLVAALIVAFTAYTSVVRREREFGVAKALGTPNRALELAALQQAAMLAAGGWIVAVALAHASEPFIEALLPEISLRYHAATVGKLGLATMAIAAAAGWLPARRVGRLDPAIVFRE